MGYSKLVSIIGSNTMFPIVLLINEKSTAIGMQQIKTDSKTSGTITDGTKTKRGFLYTNLKVTKTWAFIWFC